MINILMLALCLCCASVYAGSTEEALIKIIKGEISFSSPEERMSKIEKYLTKGKTGKFGKVSQGEPADLSTIDPKTGETILALAIKDPDVLIKIAQVLPEYSLKAALYKARQNVDPKKGISADIEHVFFSDHRKQLIQAWLAISPNDGHWNSKTDALLKYHQSLRSLVWNSPVRGALEHEGSFPKMVVKETFLQGIEPNNRTMREAGFIDYDGGIIFKNLLWWAPEQNDPKIMKFAIHTIENSISKLSSDRIKNRARSEFAQAKRDIFTSDLGIPILKWPNLFEEGIDIPDDVAKQRLERIVSSRSSLDLEGLFKIDPAHRILGKAVSQLHPGELFSWYAGKGIEPNSYKNTYFLNEILKQKKSPLAQAFLDPSFIKDIIGKAPLKKYDRQKRLEHDHLPYEDIVKILLDQSKVQLTPAYLNELIGLARTPSMKHLLAKYQQAGAGCNIASEANLSEEMKCAEAGRILLASPHIQYHPVSNKDEKKYDKDEKAVNNHGDDEDNDNNQPDVVDDDEKEGVPHRVQQEGIPDEDQKEGVPNPRKDVRK